MAGLIPGEIKINKSCQKKRLGINVLSPSHPATPLPPSSSTLEKKELLLAGNEGARLAFSSFPLVFLAPLFSLLTYLTGLSPPHTTIPSSHGPLMPLKRNGSLLP